MARADLLINLVKAGAHGDDTMFRRTVEAMIAEERQKQHHVLADRLAQNLIGDAPNLRPLRDGPGSDAIADVFPRRSLDDLILPNAVSTSIRDLLEEQQRMDVLRSHGLEPRHRVLLAGPPGNGKTSLAEAIAFELAAPLLVVRYESVIGSFLGETAARLARLFAEVRTRRAVLFFDEFDVVGKERGDEHETGEVKRVVSSLLLQVDALPSHVVIVTATNHPELLDRAVWRRFQLRLNLPMPTTAQREEWFRQLEQRLPGKLGLAPATLAKRLKDASFAELDDFGQDLHRSHVLAGPNARLPEITKRHLVHWRDRFSVNR